MFELRSFARCAAALSAAAVIAIAPAADARWMPHFDLTGLALSSEAVVHATRVSTRRPTQYQQLDTFRVTRSIAGPLRVGDTVELDTNLYNTAALTPAISADTVLFLQRLDPAQPSAWHIVSSGMRVSSGGRAYRFVQFNNPGGFDAVAQGSDPDDVRADDPSSVTPISWAELSASVDRALTRANQMRALEAQGANTPRATLLSLLAPAPDPAELLLGSRRAGFYRDVVGERVAQLFVARGDIPGVMAVAARSQGDEEGYSPVPTVPEERLWAVINDRGQGAELRAAAVRATQRSELLTVATVQRFSALVQDPSPLVRLSAARVLMARRDGFGSERGDAARLRAVRSAVDRALTEYVPRETDPVAQYALFISGLSTPSPLGNRAPRSAFFATIRGRSLRIGVAHRTARGGNPSVAAVELQLSAAQGGGVLPCGAQTATATTSTMGAAEYRVALRCANAAPGMYSARVVVTLDHAGGARVRTVDLGLIQW